MSRKAFYVKPLVWEHGQYCDTAYISKEIGYAAYPDGYWHCFFYDAEIVPTGKTADIALARVACQLHWDEVLSAALEPVEANP